MNHLGIAVNCDVEFKTSKSTEVRRVQGFLTGTGAGRYTQVCVAGKLHATPKATVEPSARGAVNNLIGVCEAYNIDPDRTGEQEATDAMFKNRTSGRVDSSWGAGE